MGSETIAFDIWLVVLCINGGLLLVDAAFPDTPLKTPFDVSGNVTGFTTGTPSQIYNTTTGTGIAQNLTSGTQSNSTIGGSPATLNPVESLFFPLAALWTFIQFVTGGFVFQVITVFGFPDVFVFSLQGIIGILFARFVVYWVWGR
jgi:hypothetical protein